MSFHWEVSSGNSHPRCFRPGYRRGCRRRGQPTGWSRRGMDPLRLSNHRLRLGQRIQCGRSVEVPASFGHSSASFPLTIAAEAVAVFVAPLGCIVRESVGLVTVACGRPVRVRVRPAITVGIEAQPRRSYSRVAPNVVGHPSARSLISLSPTQSPSVSTHWVRSSGNTSGLVAAT